MTWTINKFCRYEGNEGQLGVFISFPEVVSARRIYEDTIFTKLTSQTVNILVACFLSSLSLAKYSMSSSGKPSSVANFFQSVPNRSDNPVMWSFVSFCRFLFASPELFSTDNTKGYNKKLTKITWRRNPKNKLPTYLWQDKTMAMRNCVD